VGDLHDFKVTEDTLVGSLAVSDEPAVPTAAK
jgi:hypothetical protein